MAICFHGSGTIRLKKREEFIKQFKELLNQCDSDTTRFIYKEEEGIIQFKNYAKYIFIDDCKEIIEKYINEIEEGKLHFDCFDQDGNCEKPFPFKIMIEIVDGKLYEETLNTRLPFDWSVRFVDFDWFIENQ